MHKSPQELTPPPADENWDSWISQNDAIDATPFPAPGQASDPSASSLTYGASNIDVTIQGNSISPVILTGLEFIVTMRAAAPSTGGLVTRGCGGQLTARYVYVDLDRNPPRIVESDPDLAPLNAGDPRWLAKPIQFPYEVSASDSEVFKIDASGQCDCTWWARLSWSADGKNGESVINDHGKPFETASGSRIPVAYGYDGNRKQWYTCKDPTDFNCNVN